MKEEVIHATSIAIGGRAVLIEGASGAGKSDLALRLIDRGAMLVSDDYTRLAPTEDGLLASAPASIAGKIEVRGVGIVALPYASEVPVALVVRLTPDVERLPEPRSRVLAGVVVPEIALDPTPPSAAIKVELALRQLAGAAG